jgi:hypothetical protein
VTPKRRTKKGEAALVKRGRNRATRTIVEVIDNREGSFEDGGLAWVTLCDDHGNYCEHETRRLAMDHSRDPSGWCATCKRAARKQ